MVIVCDGARPVIQAMAMNCGMKHHEKKKYKLEKIKTWDHFKKLKFSTQHASGKHANACGKPGWKSVSQYYSLSKKPLKLS